MKFYFETWDPLSFYFCYKYVQGSSRVKPGYRDSFVGTWWPALYWHLYFAAKYNSEAILYRPLSIPVSQWRNGIWLIHIVILFLSLMGTLFNLHTIPCLPNINYDVVFLTISSSFMHIPEFNSHVSGKPRLDVDALSISTVAIDSLKLTDHKNDWIRYYGHC